MLVVVIEFDGDPPLAVDLRRIDPAFASARNALRDASGALVGQFQHLSVRNSEALEIMGEGCVHGGRFLEQQDHRQGTRGG